MQKFSRAIQIRWADVDANRHLRHSVYYDYGAMIRMMFLNEGGLTTEKLEELKMGPVLFREEAVFKREIRLEDHITVDAEVIKMTPDGSRWSIRHNFRKADGTVSTVITVDGAWIDLEKRKLTVPSEFVQKIFESFPKSSDFELIHRENK